MTKTVTRLNTKLNERLRFETLWADLSSLLIKLEPDEIDQGIKKMLQRIGEFFQGDRCGILEVQPDKRIARVNLAWYAEGIPPVPEDLNLAALFPWSYGKLVEQREAVFLTKSSDLPTEAATDRQSLITMGMGSFFCIPLVVGTAVRHIMVLATMQEECAWPDEWFPRLRLLAEICVTSLERKIAFRSALDNEERMSLAADAGNICLWSLDTDTHYIWATKKAFALCGLPQSDQLSLTSFLDVVHPEDRQRLERKILKSLQKKSDFDLEYRINHPNGSLRWILSRGRFHNSRSGKQTVMMGISTDITEQKINEEAQAEQLRFENLLADLSARIAKVESDEVDREIILALKSFAEFFKGERCLLIQVFADRKEAYITHAWFADGTKYFEDGVNLQPLFPWNYEKLVVRGECVCFSNLAELPREAEKDCLTWMELGVRSHLSIPLFIGKNVRYIFALNHMLRERVWPPKYFPRLRLIGEVFVNALTRKQIEKELRESFDEIRRLQEKLQLEAEYLRSEIKLSRGYDEIIGQSQAIKGVMRQVEQVANTNASVLISGETGTGKELVARAIHDGSPRRDEIMVKVNCASLPPSLVESELFGREKGAYTGAMTRQIGRFEMADHGTIFLDEISEMSPELQAKLLRVLQEGQFERLGSPKTIQVDVRVIAATNRNLFEEIKKGKFREDLYYRLNVFPIVVPPLRERTDDIPLLVWAFIQEFSEKMGKKLTRIASRDMEALQSFAWPGNVRELRNVIEHAAIISSGDTLTVRLPKQERRETSRTASLHDAELKHIMGALRQTGWRIKGEDGAASLLGLKPSTLYSRMQKLNIPLRKEKDGIPA